MSELLHTPNIWIVPVVGVIVFLYTIWDFRETNRVFQISLLRDVGSLLFEIFMTMLLTGAGMAGALMLVGILNGC
jgi:hypothetical protein